MTETYIVNYPQEFINGTCLKGFEDIIAALKLGNTVARWPNFRPNNSKEAPKNCQWPEKIGGC
jgi:hypothetical protein